MKALLTAPSPSISPAPAKVPSAKITVPVTIQIGNSDDKLTQSRWSGFVRETNRAIEEFSTATYFAGTSANDRPWQNACWVVEVETANEARLIAELSRLAQRFDQDSIAYTRGWTSFIKRAVPGGI